MADYIDREAAIKALVGLTAYDDGPAVNAVVESAYHYRNGWIGGIRDALIEIGDLPAADVVERKRGVWVKAKGSWFTPGGDPVWECSECGKGRHTYGIEHGTYGADVADGQWVSCPNCGADMRPEPKEET